LNIYSKKQTWKRLLFITAALIGISSLVYTDRLVKQLAQEEENKVKLWAKATELLANSADETIDISFVFEVIRDNETVPVILTDQNENIISVRNLDSLKSLDTAYVKNELQQMKKIHSPIEVGLVAGEKNLIFYQNSRLYYSLKYYPYIQLAVISLFVFVSYLAFSTSRRSEQDQVWVGMAKETAHQLGTPISSLLAWMEHLRAKGVDEQTLTEIGQDLKRLETITERFSKIGATPKLEPQNISKVMEESVNYMKLRSSKKVVYNFNLGNTTDVTVPMNIPLFEWVIENLCRNAIDAMNGAGTITVEMEAKEGQVIIDVSDTGKGMPKSKFKTVFEPGFTTKQRGWGLGLSLTKRIIENYHSGKIFVKNSVLDKGTTFRIILNS
jgi:nitrogen-specific signal transduction histidine kinase